MVKKSAAYFLESRGALAKNTRSFVKNAYVLGAVLAATAYVFVTDPEVREDLVSIFRR
jgi:hypothetical protein